uniref:Uncharacterized protein n=1 Tax=Cucumis melo TaxID=3656 RepID=A0A9I9E2B4_CUCME
MVAWFVIRIANEDHGSHRVEEVEENSSKVYQWLNFSSFCTSLNVGANSDIHLVLFDEENRAVGFHSKSGGLWFFLNKLKRSCARDSGSGSVLRIICVYARGIRFICLQVSFRGSQNEEFDIKNAHFG